MQRFHRCERNARLLRERQLVEGFGRIRMGPAGAISGNEYAALRMMSAAWVDDVLVELIGPGEPAVDAITLPEARSLERNLGAFEKEHVLERGLLGGREIIGDP